MSELAYQMGWKAGLERGKSERDALQARVAELEKSISETHDLDMTDIMDDHGRPYFPAALKNKDASNEGK